MNVRTAVLADNPELILRVLPLRFDESLSYLRISAQTGVSKTAIFSLVKRFHQVFDLQLVDDKGLDPVRYI